MSRTFKATLTDAGGGGVFVYIPYDCEKEYGVRGQVKVKATFDGEPYRGSIANMGSGNLLIVLKSIRAKIGKQVGDEVQVVVERDTEARKVEMPDVLVKTLAKNKKARMVYDGLSFTLRKEYAMWIAAAKRPETTALRLQKVMDKLQETQETNRKK